MKTEIKVMFSAILTADDTSLFRQDKIIKFDRVLVNIPSNAYNPSTGKFTAPVSGYYMFLTDCASPHHKNVQIILYIDEERLIYALDSGQTTGHSTTSTSLIKQVNKGSEAYVMRKANEHDGARANGCTFSGYLLDAL